MEGDLGCLSCGVWDKPYLWGPFSTSPTLAFQDGETSSFHEEQPSGGRSRGQLWRGVPGNTPFTWGRWRSLDAEILYQSY